MPTTYKVHLINSDQGLATTLDVPDNVNVLAVAEEQGIEDKSPQANSSIWQGSCRSMTSK